MLSLLRPFPIAALSLALALPAVAQSTAEIGGLRFIGAVTVPNDVAIDGTLVGGLSGIDYDPAADLWYLISDDKSDKSPARFYTAKLTFDQARFASVEIARAVTLLQAGLTASSAPVASVHVIRPPNRNAFRICVPLGERLEDEVEASGVMRRRG